MRCDQNAQHTMYRTQLLVICKFFVNQCIYLVLGTQSYYRVYKVYTSSSKKYHKVFLSHSSVISTTNYKYQSTSALLLELKIKGIKQRHS